ncbi:MAG: endoribonuclease [Burkholderiales bacterium]|jgi:reactive intermediate/imine deaminase|nr:endoribonuclease [Burkholderiales bacterium]MCE3268825.1 endoribonuclease [Burkholderiales bacterium]
MKQVIHTNKAPKAIGCYSQAIKADNTIYISGQLGFIPDTMELESGVEAQAEQMFKNLKEVVIAAGATLNDIVKLNIYLTDMNNFATINTIMAKYFTEPYPARAAIGVKELPKAALVEADAIAVAP